MGEEMITGYTGPWAASRICGTSTHCAIFQPVEKGPQRRLFDAREATIAECQVAAAAPDLLTAMESLFEHCAMIHNRWGEGCNLKEANAALAAGRAAIAKARGQE